VPFVFVKNVVQIAFLPQWPSINANIFATFREIILGALYDCIYFSSLPHGRSEGGPLALVLNSQSKRDSYGAAYFCNTSLSKICVFLFVNCVFIFRIANTFVVL
jgi:hypothetical protein